MDKRLNHGDITGIEKIAKNGKKWAKKKELIVLHIEDYRDGEDQLSSDCVFYGKKGYPIYKNYSLKKLCETLDVVAATPSSHVETIAAIEVAIKTAISEFGK